MHGCTSVASAGRARATDYGPDRLLSLSHITEGAQFYLFDALGSVVNLTRNDGSIQARYQYDAWGHIKNQVGTSANVFGFTGHEMDPETGLIYMKARLYDPDTGRFLSQDAFEGTVDTPPSLHKYLYAFGNPLFYFDPSGNVTEPIDPEVDLAGARAQARENTRRQKESALFNEACAGANRPSSCFESSQAVKDAVQETFEDTRGVGSDSAITSTCPSGDVQCFEMEQRERALGGLVRANEIVADSFSGAADFIDEQATDPTNALILVPGGGFVKNVPSSAKKTLWQKAKEFASSSVDRVARLFRKKRPTTSTISKADLNADFLPQGLQIDPRSIPEGQRLLARLRKADPSASNKAIFGRAQRQIRAGVAAPKLAEVRQGEKLFKLVPKGTPTSEFKFSSFFVDAAGLARIKASKKNIADVLGLPNNSAARAFDVFVITPKQGKIPTVFRSKVAPIQQGSIRRPGGEEQVIVPERNLFTEPELVETLMERL